MNIAVIKVGGKQYLMSEGKKIQVDFLKKDKGSSISLETLLVSDEKGENVSVGKPSLAALSGRVVGNRRGKKISVIKFKRKVRYRRNKGHRQDYTDIVVDKI